MFYTSFQGASLAPSDRFFKLFDLNNFLLTKNCEVSGGKREHVSDDVLLSSLIGKSVQRTQLKTFVAYMREDAL